MRRAFCATCRNKGALVIRYEDGGPFDLALCECPAGEIWRCHGEAAVRAHFKLTANNQVTDLAAIQDELPPAPKAVDRHLEAAARTGKGPRL